jgi:hypothetical protein
VQVYIRYWAQVVLGLLAASTSQTVICLSVSWIAITRHLALQRVHGFPARRIQVFSVALFVSFFLVIFLTPRSLIGVVIWVLTAVKTGMYASAYCIMRSTFSTSPK